jgi:hypothetical protein
MLNLNIEWLTSGNDLPEIQQTMGWLGLKVGDISLTRNEDIWSQTIRDRVLVSAYPLAEWIVSSWWRLHYEPLPPAGLKPSVDWRISHELAAANQGFIWPRVILASDTESMQIWSTPTHTVDQQSVRYINGLEHPHSINLLDFEQIIETFIQVILYRLEATKTRNSSLANLWQEVQEERCDSYASQYRRCEAELGFDPDECPESLVIDAIDLAKKMGAQTISEIAPACTQQLSDVKPLSATIHELTQTSGLNGKPNISIDYSVTHLKAPWQKAKDIAEQVRNVLDLPIDQPVNDHLLLDLLGLSQSEYDVFAPQSRRLLAIAMPSKSGFKFHPRKKHPIAKRFELARFIGDYVFYGNHGNSWLASTDLKTSRQKYQRAFAAEFLCPLHSLRAYLEDDYSESAIEDAAEHFQVSPKTIESSLTNHGILSAQSVGDLEANLPY